MTDYTNLIARLEAAEGPSRELDYQIQRLVFSPMTGGNPVREFTRSLDAAVSLVPEGMQYCMGCLSDTRVPVRGVSRYHAWVGSMETIFAPTLALALCIAALKARENGA